MSLTRSTCQELCDFILNKPSTVLGHKFFDCRVAIHAEVAQKHDKFEPRIFVISKFRVFLLSGKTPSSLKIDRSFHLLTIKGIQVLKDDEVSVSIDEAGSRRKFVLRGNPSLQMSIHLLSAIKHYFPDIGPVLRSLIEIHPSNLYQTFDGIRIEVTPRPCHSFRRTYAALCDYFDQPYREEVSWDVEKIYTVNKIRDLRIEDFSHLLPKDLLPIVGVLQFSSYFTGVSVDGLKLTSDLVDVILSVIRRSHWITHLRLVNCGLPKDFITLLSSALSQNPSLPLEIIDLSRNPFDDKKGFQSLSTVLPRLCSLRELTLSECTLTDKCCSLLCQALYGSLSPNRSSSSMQLSHLSLPKNQLSGDPSALVNLVSLCNSLRVIDLRDTQISLDKLWPALKYGGLQLEKLLLAGCNLGSKKTWAESVQPVKEFFSMAVNLNEIDFSNTLIPVDILKGMLLGLACNQQLQPFSLCLNGAVDKGGAAVLEACLPGVGAKSLALRDNNFEQDLQGIIASLCGMPSLRRIDIGGANVLALRRSNKQTHSQQLNKILLEVVKLIGDEGHIDDLILSDARLGAHLSVLLNTLGATSCLRHLDISSNEMGNFGARILSKALQLNVSLRTISIDCNHVTGEGFADLASAMNWNHTLVSLPFPVQDASEALMRSDRPKALSALSQLEYSLERNRAVSSPEEANYKRAMFTLQQGCDGMSFESICNAEGLLLDARGDGPIPLSMKASIEGFVEKLRGQMLDHISSVLRDDSSGAEAVLRIEKVAVDRLREVMVKDIGGVLSEWKWRAACETSEGVLRVGGANGSMGGVSGGSPSSAIASPRIPHRVDTAHRPKSMVGDLSSPMEETGVTLDTPPKPSGLVHLAKGRPRPQRRQLFTDKSSSTPSDDISRSVCEGVSEIDEDGRSQSSDSGGGGDAEKEETKKPISLSDRPVFRAAMLPEASLLAAAQLRPANERTLGNLGSPKTEKTFRFDPRDPPLSPDETPPPIPRRNKLSQDGSPSPLTPPCLPPKPPVGGASAGGGVSSTSTRMGAVLPTVPPPTDAPGALDDENANNRRSVADITRIFQR